MTSNKGFHFSYNKRSKYSACTRTDCLNSRHLSLFLRLKLTTSANYLDQKTFLKKHKKTKFSNCERGKAKSSNILPYVSQKTVPLTKDSIVTGTICCETYCIN